MYYAKTPAVIASLALLSLALVPSIAVAQFPQVEMPAVCSGPASTTTNLMYGQGTSMCLISTPVETDVFTFFGTAGDQVRITVDTSSNAMDPRVRLLDPTGSPTFLLDASCVHTCTMEHNLVLVNTAQHTIFVSDMGSDETGSYTLQIERIPPVAAPPVFPVSVAVNDSISPATDHDFLTFQAEAGAVLELIVNATSDAMDPRIEIWDPTGAPIIDTFCLHACAMTVPLNPTITGQYLVAVSDEGHDETGAYQLSLQCLFSPSGCPPVGGGLTLAASQPNGSGSAAIAGSGAIPNVPYSIAISSDMANATQPGLGWWGGLHIDVLQLATQISSGVPLYVGMTDALGATSFSAPGGSVPLGLPTFYAVMRTFDSNYSSITGTSNVESLTIL